MKAGLAPLVRFGAFELDVRRAELRNGNGAISLQEQPFQVLLMLVQRDGELVTREEIQKKLWPDDTVVEFDQSINAAIKKLRRALGDSADEPKYIRTIAKQGYRLIMPVEQMAENGNAVESTGAKEAIVSTGTKKGTRVRWLWLLAAAGTGLAVIATALYWPSKTHAKLTDTDTIVLADFTNSTGDPVFDDTLKQALTIQLRQSPFLNILSNGRVRQTLKLMNRSANNPLTEDVTREVCVRTGTTAMLIGSIAQPGSRYVIGLRAIACNTGDNIVELREEANSRDDVLNALDKAAGRLRTKLGESLSSVAKHSTPLPEATTQSLEALKAYSVARRFELSEGPAAGLPFLKRAVELDPNFAMAYHNLSVYYDNLNEFERSRECARKAYELRHNLSERERFTLEGGYYQDVTGELYKAAHAYEQLQQNYPRDVAGVGNLGFVYSLLGNVEGYLRQGLAAMPLEPNYYVVYSNVAAAYRSLNRIDEAEQTLQTAGQHGLSEGHLLVEQYQLAFLEADRVKMAATAAAAASKPGVEDLLLASQADTDAWHGKLKNARKLTQRAIDSAERDDAKESAAGYLASAALREAASGNLQLARANARDALKLSQTREVVARSALASAQANDVDAAEQLSSELDKAYPLDTLIQHYWLPTIRAAIALQRKVPNQAIEQLEGLGMLELSAGDVYLCPAYVRGYAYLMQHNAKAAAAEFQKFVDHYGLVSNFPWGALARLGLARSYALEAQSDPTYREKARTAYQNFLTIWKDADPDIPIYRQAEAEYAKLQ